MITYSIKKNRLKKSGLFGIDLMENGALTLKRDTDRHLYLPAIDSAEKGASWGRLSFDCDILQFDIVTFDFSIINSFFIYISDYSITHIFVFFKIYFKNFVLI